MMFRLKTLGGLALIGDTPAPVHVQRQRLALLAVLAAAGDEGTSRDRLLGLLWPESSEESARHSLGQQLYAVRRDLGSPEAILGTADARLNRDFVSCDLWDFERAIAERDFERAVELYAGPFLEGVHLKGSAELDHWVDAERQRLAALFQGGLEALARMETARGNHLGAAQWWRLLAAAVPISSRVTVELMRSLAAGGDRAAALQAARVHAVLVRDELDSEPDPAVRAYLDELRSEPTGEVRETPSLPATLTAPALEVRPAQLDPVANPHRRQARKPLVLTALGAAVVAGLFVTFNSLAPNGRVLGPKRVYIAPLENRTGDPALDPVGAMAAAWIAHGLEQSGLIEVASSLRSDDRGDQRGAVEADAGAAARAAELRAGTLISGAYYRQGESLHFQAQISDVNKGEELATVAAVGGSSRDPLEPIEVLRQRAIGSLASLFDPRLDSWMRIATKPPTYEAYREFVTGQSIWASDYRQALSHFQRAVALDSTFYAATVEMAILHRLLGECERTEAIAAQLANVRDKLAPFDYHQLDSQVAQCRGDWERAYREARALAELRPGSAFLDYNYALQAVITNRRREAEQVLARHDFEAAAAEIGANYFAVYAQALGARGALDRAVEVARWGRTRFREQGSNWGVEAALLARRGRVLDAERLVDSLLTVPIRPVTLVPRNVLLTTGAFEAGGHREAALRSLARGIEWLESRPAYERATPPQRLNLSLMLHAAGRHEEALRIAEQLVAADSTNVEFRAQLGLAAARLGDVRTAEQVDGWLAGAPAPQQFRNTHFRSRIAASLGKRREAIALLEQALRETGYFGLVALREHPDYAALRGDPEFEKVVRVR